MIFKIFLLFLLSKITFSYYSLKLNKIYYQVPSNNYNNCIGANKENNKTIKKLIKNLQKYNKLPLINSELNY